MKSSTDGGPSTGTCVAASPHPACVWGPPPGVLRAASTMCSQPRGPPWSLGAMQWWKVLTWGRDGDPIWSWAIRSHRRAPQWDLLCVPAPTCPPSGTSCWHRAPWSRPFASASPRGEGAAVLPSAHATGAAALGHRVQVPLSLPRPLPCPSCGLSVLRGCGSPGLQRDRSLRAGPGADLPSLPGLLPSRQHHDWPGVKADASGGPRLPASWFLTLPALERRPHSGLAFGT